MGIRSGVKTHEMFYIVGLLIDLLSIPKNQLDYIKTWRFNRNLLLLYNECIGFQLKKFWVPRIFSYFLIHILVSSFCALNHQLLHSSGLIKT